MDAFQELACAETLEDLEAVVRRHIEDRLGCALVVGLTYLENAEHLRTRLLGPEPVVPIPKAMLCCALLMAAHARWLKLQELPDS